MEYQSEQDLERTAGECSTDMHAIDEIAQRQLGMILEKAVEQLPIKYRSVFVLRAVQQLNTCETAASLNLSENAVKQRFLRALTTDQLDGSGRKLRCDYLGVCWRPL